MPDSNETTFYLVQIINDTQISLAGIVRTHSFNVKSWVWSIKNIPNIEKVKIQSQQWKVLDFRDNGEMLLLYASIFQFRRCLSHFSVLEESSIIYDGVGNLLSRIYSFVLKNNVCASNEEKKKKNNRAVSVTRFCKTGKYQKFEIHIFIYIHTYVRMYV